MYYNYILPCNLILISDLRVRVQLYGKSTRVNFFSDCLADLPGRVISVE
jgi:hypothetical protein